MLSQLYINNVAVIREATIEFARGFNVFTGETGAGKTILIHAINAVLGERTSRDIIRTGEERAVISALFTGISQTACEMLAQAGYDAPDAELLISREIGVDGRSSCKINGRPATAAILKSISPLLIHVHGQHDTQQLLSAQQHLPFIDSFGETGELLARYRKVYGKYTAVRRELEEIDADEAEKARQIDLLDYQINEIEAAQLEPDEEDELKARRKLIKNALHVTQALGGSLAILDGDGEQSGLSELFSLLTQNVSTVAEYMEEARATFERLTDIEYELEGIADDIRNMLARFDCDPSEMDAIERRLDLIYSLRRKYGADIPAILAFYEHACAQRERIETSEIRARQLEEQLSGLETQLSEAAEALSTVRLDAARRFVDAVQEELAFLDMPSVRLTFSHRKKSPGPDGADDFELFISTNVGEQEKSLAKIASGGELSRIMLSIKNVLAGRDNVQTLIFDEVDAGVSGRAAQKIGSKLAQVARDRQVIVVTHLAQVAAYARHHLLIYKTTKDERTYTSIDILDEQARVRELARITGGEVISEAALAHAREMLSQAGN